MCVCVKSCLLSLLGPYYTSLQGVLQATTPRPSLPSYLEAASLQGHVLIVSSSNTQSRCALFTAYAFYCQLRGKHEVPAIAHNR